MKIDRNERKWEERDQRRKVGKKKSNIKLGIPCN